MIWVIYGLLFTALACAAGVAWCVTQVLGLDGIPAVFVGVMLWGGMWWSGHFLANWEPK